MYIIEMSICHKSTTVTHLLIEPLFVVNLQFPTTEPRAKEVPLDRQSQLMQHGCRAQSAASTPEYPGRRGSHLLPGSRGDAGVAACFEEGLLEFPRG